MAKHKEPAPGAAELNNGPIDIPADYDVIDAPSPEDDVDVEILEMLSEYALAYPDAKGFYVTSDKQVFVSKNKPEAFAHQKSLEPGTEPEYFSIK